MKIKTLKQLFGNKCYYCGKPVGSDGSREHLIPESQKGQQGSNLRLTHKKCNWRRGKIFNHIDNIYCWIALRKKTVKALSQLDYVRNNLSIQDGPWTYSYLNEMKFVLRNPQFLVAQLQGV